MKIENRSDGTWEILASYFLIFLIALALGYAWRYAQETQNDISEQISPDKVVVIRHCKEVARR